MLKSSILTTKKKKKTTVEIDHYDSLKNPTVY